MFVNWIINMIFKALLRLGCIANLSVNYFSELKIQRELAVTRPSFCTTANERVYIRSEYRDQFVLKSALLFELWTHRPYRPTRDLDLSGQGDSSIARMKKVFGDVLAQVVEDDGLVFDPTSIRITRIKEEQE